MFRQIKNTSIYYLTRAAILFFSFLPAWLAPAAGHVVGFFAHSIAARERELARKHLSAALNKPKESKTVTLVVKGVFLSLGQSAIELCRLFRSQGTLPRVIFSGSSRLYLDQGLCKGKGLVFITGHIGNWELMASALASMGYPISTVAKESYDPRFTALIDRFRTALGVESIYRGRPGASAAMLRALKKNRILGFLIDQDSNVPGEFVPFFGKQAYTPIGPAVIAGRMGASIVVGSIRRNRFGDNVIEIEDCAICNDPHKSTAALTNMLEQRIRRHPTQWVWFHERWKTRPAQETIS